MPVELGSAYGKIEIGTEGAESNIAKLQSTLNSAGKNLTLGVTAPLVGLGVMALKTAGDFEQTMNVLDQVSGATSDQMAQIQAQALELGAITSFSAQEAGDAQLELAKAGLEVNDVMEATPGVLDLAAAGNLGLAESAEIAANAMNSFGMDASDMPEIANMLAAAANASSLDVGELARSMKMAGAVFASNDQPIQQLIVSLSMLGNAGMKGSDAGTSLKTMLLSLAAPTDKAYGAIQNLGLAVYDEQGNMRDFSSILNDLSIKTAKMSDEQRNVTLSTIFGSDAIRAASILTRDYSKSWDTLSDAVGEQGAAAAVANARMKGMAGAVEYMKGSIDSFLISTALPFLGTFSGIIRQAADGLTALSALPEPTRNMALAFALAAASIGPLLLGLSGLMTLLGLLASPVGLVAIAVAALGAAWYTNFGGIQQITAQVWSQVKPWLDSWVAYFQATLPGALAYLQAQTAALWTQISTSVATAWAVALPVLTQWWSWLQVMLPAAYTSLLAWALPVWQTISSSVSTAWNTISPLFTQMQTWLLTSIPAAVTATKTAWGNLPATWASVQASLSSGLSALQTAWEKVSTFLEPSITRLGQTFGTLPTTLAPLMPAFQQMGAAVGQLVMALQPLVMLIGAGLAIATSIGISQLSAVFQNLPNILIPIITQVTDTIKLITTVITSVTNTVKALIAGDWTGAWTAAQEPTKAFAAYYKTTLDNLGNLAAGAFKLVYDIVINALTDLGIDVKPTLNAIKSTFEDIWGKITETMAPITGMVDAIMDKFSGFRDFLSGLSLPNPFSALEAAGNAVSGLLGQFGGGGKATGTSYFSGGFTPINERGPEAVILPAGSRVLTNGQTNNRGSETESRVINITIPNVTISGAMDMKRFKWMLADELAGI